ncbi:hypothetical protein ACLMJK_003285 [Lecanora helva]
MPPKKDIPKLGPKKKGDVPGAKADGASKSSEGRTSSPATRPSATPSTSSTDVRRKPPKLGSRQNSEASFASSQPRKPSLAPRTSSSLSRRTSSIDQSSRPPPKKLPPRQGSITPSESPRERIPSLAPRTSSNLGKAVTGSAPERKPPKLGPRNKNATPQKQTPPSKASGASANKISRPETQDGPAQKLDEEQQDLRSILEDSNCEDLIRLAASITNQMRKGIEDNFNATATLKKIGSDNGNEDKFASLDYDPGTVDVAAYDKERKLRDERQKELSSPKVKELKAASLKWFDDWRSGFLKRVDETINPGKTPLTQLSRSDGNQKSSLAEPRPIQSLGADAKGTQHAPPKLEQLFPRISTSLTKLPLARRNLVLHSFLLLLLSLEHYNAASRVFLLYLASSLKLGLKALRDDEERTAKGLLQAAKEISASKDTIAKGKESEENRRWKMRLATAAGAAVIGLSGGYAAPMIAASVGAMMSEMGLGTSAAAGYLGSVASNTYLVGSLFGAYGGHMTGEMMRNLSADVEDFAFLPIHGERKEHENSINAATDYRRLRVVISISGWLLEKEDIIAPWRVLKPSAESFALRFEMETLMNLGQSINTMTANDAYGYAESAFTQRAMVTDLTSAIWPLALVKIARVIENPFSLAKARADKAGKVLAEALLNRTQGERPVTLVGYSLGARVIWSCLTTLVERKAFGLIESAVLLGAPIPSDIGTWRSMRTAVTGRLINVYSKNDYLLAFLYRTSSLQYGVAGLMPISGLSGVENFDVSENVSGHLRYRYLVGSILQQVGFEDIDKDEVAKEADAYKKMTEEEEKNKRDYVEEVKENAGELYKKYAKRGKQPPTKKISDKEADKQASDMEKEVQQKTQKGLMQWAVEQLYLSRPSAPSADDVKNAKSDPQALTKGSTKSAQKTTDAATKSMYQRAKEAVYISRSGGPEAEDAAKGKLEQAKGSASTDQTSYLATAAGYIPTNYIPSLRSSGAANKGDSKPPKVKKEKPTAKAPTQGKATKPAEAAEEVHDKPAEDETKVKPEDVEDATQDSKDQGEADTPVEANVDTQDVGNTTGGASEDTPKNLSENATEDPSRPDSSKGPADEGEQSSDVAQSFCSAESRVQEHEDDNRPTSKGYSSYIPSFGFGSSYNTKGPSQISNNPPASSEATEKKPEDRGSSGSTPTKAEDAKKAESSKTETSSYGSYIPSFGLGRSAPSKSPKPSAEGPKETQEGKAAEGEDTSFDEKKSGLDDPFVD